MISFASTEMVAERTWIFPKGQDRKTTFYANLPISWPFRRENCVESSSIKDTMRGSYSFSDAWLKPRSQILRRNLCSGIGIISVKFLAVAQTLPLFKVRQSRNLALS